MRLFSGRGLQTADYSCRCPVSNHSVHERVTVFNSFVTRLAFTMCVTLTTTHCAHRAMTPSGDTPVTCRSIVRIKDERISPVVVADRLRLDLQSVTALGDGHYRIMVRSRTEADCLDSIARFNADADVSYAVTDERKRTH